MSETSPDSSIDAAARHGDEPGAERRTRTASLRSLPDAELALRVAHAVADDRKFFELNSNRQYRARRAFEVELEHFARRGMIRRCCLEPPLSWHVAVHRVLPGLRLRIPLAVAHLPEQSTEGDARVIYRIAATPRLRRLAMEDAEE